ncbi:hypothetical protein DFH07DRAFT_769267 [Mycena maculata]|uniref:Uncharacterized protein n=1 Tax=Mycena maculata TaxID=230809 RepID=A0AAD7JNV1_9AGAR|nr:hypothetical protein DFH07DRAFT_769267 [Mycena maculata]
MPRWVVRSNSPLAPPPISLMIPSLPSLRAVQTRIRVVPMLASREHEAKNHGNVDQVVHQWDLSAASPQTQDSVSMSDLTAAVAGVSLAEEIAAASAASPQTQDSVSMSDLTAAVAGVSLAEEIAAALGGVSIATQWSVSDIALFEIISHGAQSSSHSPQSPGSHSVATLSVIPTPPLPSWCPSEARLCFYCSKQLKNLGEVLLREHRTNRLYTSD